MPKPQDPTRNKTGPRLLAGLLMAAMLTACGYKGPLYMPPPPAPDESLTTPPASTTLPATEAGSPVEEPSSATPSPVQ
ncbi:hypothetical protein PT7_2853 [Pusillimonas sp. T7-7]|uniref:LPS translocon maturation chaperone LptM n=1 Tax=Pusillimonas sp. (strain T7-7) TaxID=1007105 RepID=UPI0002085595|nr:lipoprotein [Pusillimonas sp. T7-7]AEC21393.1 hypothetical protein PT7_2853 [Pusillimonas sp. T7-7]